MSETGTCFIKTGYQYIRFTGSYSDKALGLMKNMSSSKGWSEADPKQGMKFHPEDQMRWEKICLLDPLFIIGVPMYSFHPDFSFHHQAWQNLGHTWGTHNSIVCKLVEKSPPPPLNPKFGTWNFYTCLVVGVRQAIYLANLSCNEKLRKRVQIGGFCVHCNKFGGIMVNQTSQESWVW